jgi:hypothetical protein
VQARRDIAGHHDPSRVDGLLGQPLDQGREQIGLALEVVVHKPLRHARLLGDLGGGRGVEAARGEELLRCGEDPLTGSRPP